MGFRYVFKVAMLLAFCLLCHPENWFALTQSALPSQNYSPKPKRETFGAVVESLGFSLLGSQTKIHKELPNVK